MNYYSIFYWLTVADGVKKFFDVASNVFCWIFALSFIANIFLYLGYCMEIAEQKTKTEQEDGGNPEIRSFLVYKKFLSRVMYTCLCIGLISWIGYVFTPSKKDCLLIVAGGAVGNFITQDSSAKKIPSDIALFLHENLKKQILSIESDTARKATKSTFLDKAKSMSKEEIIDYLKKDSTFKN